MSNTRSGRFVNGVKSDPITGYVETDPSGRYGRFKEVLGKGAMKVVYRGFDEVLGVEVAWNQINIDGVCRSLEELQRLYSEVHLLKSLRHDSIMKFHTSWIDSNRRNFNFITEMFTSGTLREYRQKYRRVDIRAIKNWAVQILSGLCYLHGLDPPVIHRDLKCDNIFVNGHLGQVKIGDLGLAAILRGSQHAHSFIGTPEFMAPELYEEKYDELVDIYSFGMCVVEMLTSEYPYSECSNPAQIYKKVTSGKLPEAFHRIQDPEAKRFVGKCLENVSKRLPARELLLDPFLSLSDEQNWPIIPRNPTEKPSLLVNPEDRKRTTNMSITGTLSPEDDTIFLKVRISDMDEENGARNVYFPFDAASDTAADVAAEMVKELEIGDWEAAEIAEMIEEQVRSLVPDWNGCESPRFVIDSFGYDDGEEEDDDGGDIIDDRRLYSSSCSSSNSLFVLSSSKSRGNNMISTGLNFIQDNQFVDDDTSSVSSFNSLNYSNINYYSAVEDTEHDTKYNSTLGSTRLGRPTETVAVSRGGSPRPPGPVPAPPRRLAGIRSFFDMRSQVLHRSLVEEISKRRAFNTVGSVESVGFQDIGEEFSGGAYRRR